MLTLLSQIKGRGFARVWGLAVPSLAQLYEDHAEECIRSAAREDDPKRRDLLLKFASQWREAAEALKRGEDLDAAPALARRIKRWRSKR